jgi:hypothetical protein
VSFSFTARVMSSICNSIYCSQLMNQRIEGLVNVAIYFTLASFHMISFGMGESSGVA